MVFTAGNLFPPLLQLGQWDRVPINQTHDLKSLDLPHLYLHNRETLRSHSLIQVLEEVFALFLIFLHDFFLSVERVLALKKLWHLLLRGFNKIVNAFLEFAPYHCLEPQEDRCLWILEVIYIAEFIWQLGIVFGDLFKQFSNGRHPPRACETCDRNVVSGFIHTHTKGEGLYTSFLPFPNDFMGKKPVFKRNDFDPKYLF